MTDIANHSPEIWRTFIFYSPHYTLKKFTEEYCIVFNFRYSFQNYSEIEDEEAHISFRIAFPNSNALEEFRRNLDECILDTPYVKYDEIGYDEGQGIKMAYVLGTELYNSFMENFDLFKCNISEFLMLLLHGFFNDLGFVYIDEAKFYNYATKRLLTQMG